MSCRGKGAGVYIITPPRPGHDFVDYKEVV